MAPFSKPETVLKQAEGLVSVGQNHAALQSLTDIFQSKRLRSTPLASLEPIMLRFVELCVDMRKGRTAKEGLMQYKNIAQNTSVGSIEVVIKRFVSLADQKVQDAQEKADQVVVSLEDVDDLEATETPESILLGAVSGDQSKDRTDRALVTPWLKFLWESYRTALETLKNNARLELIYQQIAQQAFKFCLKHTRKVEFRRLCETLRLHLTNVAKYSHQPHAINLSDPDTLQRHLETRFAQLSAAVELELWQEAFRSVEDVHNLLTMAKKAPRPSMMAGYYEKLTRIFLMSGNSLYHAAAWNRYYLVVRTNPSANVAKFPEDESMSKLAGIVLLSALAVPIHGDSEHASGRISRSTALLGLSKMPTRASLLTSALTSCLLNNVPLVKSVAEPIKALYHLLETSFDPLKLCSKAATLLEELSTTHNGLYKAYIPSLQDVILSRLLHHLSQVYDTMNTQRLLDLITPLLGPDRLSEKVETLLVNSARRGELSVKVDHSTGIISFVDDVFAGSSRSASTAGVQQSASDLVRTRLSTVATVLLDTLTVIHPPASSTVDFAALSAAAEADRKSLTQRRNIIARRRELQSELSARKEKEDAGRRAEASRREKDEEARRALEDARRRDLERARKEREKIKEEEVMVLMKSLKERGTLKVDMEVAELPDRDSLMELQVKQLEKEKREQAERIRIIAKRLDHVERAFRKEEKPLIAKDYERQQAEDKVAQELAALAKLEAAKERHATALATKTRLTRMMDDYKAHRAAIAEKRGGEYARKKEEAGRKVEEEKAFRRRAIAKAKEEERKRKQEEERLRQEAEAAEARAEEERLALQRQQEAEEAARIEAEEAEKRAKQEELLKAKAKREAERKEAEEAARKQREREEAAEERARLRKEQERQGRQNGPAKPPAQDGGGAAWRRNPPAESNQGDTPPTPQKWRPGVAAAGGGGGATWRDRQRLKQESGAGGQTTPPPGNSPKPQEEEGFQTVKPSRGVWRPSRGR